MHDYLFETQGEWSGHPNVLDLFTDYANTLGLDADAFSTCMESGKYTAAVESDFSEGQQLGVSGTPAFFLNGYFLSGAQPYEVFAQAIESLMNEQ